MPTVCKITLDATEYRRELAAVVAESREAARTLAAVSSAPSPSGAVSPSGSMDSMTPDATSIGMSSEPVEIPASIAVDTVEAEQTIDELKNTPVEIPATVTANTDPASDAIDDLEDKPVKPEATVTADTTPAENEMNDLEKKPVEVEAKVTADTSQAEAATSKVSKFGTAIRGAMKGNVGEQIGKGAAAIGAVGAMAGAAVPPVGALAAVVNALLSPIAIVTAAIAALVAIGMEVWDYLTVSAEEYAEKTKYASEAAEKHAEKVREQDQAAQAYMDRLREIATIENAGNSTKAETAQILQVLQERYGDLGAEIDSTTGRVKNLLEVEQRLNEERGRRLGTANMKQAEAYMNEAKAAYTKARGSEWSTTEIYASGEFQGMMESRTYEQILADLEQRAQNASRSDEISGYNDAINKVKAAIEARDRAASAVATGYESREEYEQALAQKKGAAGAAQRDRDAAIQAAADRRSDDEFSDLRDIDAKKANRQERIAAEQAERQQLQSELDIARQNVAKAEQEGNAIATADALKIQYDLERQIDTLDKQRAEAVNRITTQAKNELEYNALIIAGEYDKAAALKLEQELKAQNLKLTKEEKDAILEQRKALGSQNLKRNLQDQAFDLYGQAMNKAGLGKEFEMQKALRDAERAKGAELTEEEANQVKMLTSLSYDLANQRDMQFGDTSIKTNSLTSRGGFSGGAKMPDSEKINREIATTSKLQLEQMKIITMICEKLGAF